MDDESIDDLPIISEGSRELQRDFTLSFAIDRSWQSNALVVEGSLNIGTRIRRVDRPVEWLMTSG